MEDQRWYHISTGTDRWIGQEDVDILGPDWQKRLRKNHLPYEEAFPPEVEKPIAVKKPNAKTVIAKIKKETDLEALDELVKDDTRASVLKAYKDRIEKLTT